jgi:hypothetical protein
MENTTFPLIRCGFTDFIISSRIIIIFFCGAVVADLLYIYQENSISF